jgi:hypothetical protein
VMVASHETVRSGTMIGLQEIWPVLVQSNPDLLHAIIATSASNQAGRDAEIMCSNPQDLLQEKTLMPHSRDYLFHQAKAIQFINEKLLDPAKACADATLGAVIFLICSDVSPTILHL